MSAELGSPAHYGIPYWGNAHQSEIIPSHDLPLNELWSETSKLHATGMSFIEWYHFKTLVTGAYALEHANRLPWVQNIRKKMGIPLSEETDIQIDTIYGHENLELYPFQNYLTTLEEDEVQVSVFLPERIDANHPDFTKRLISNVFSTALSRESQYYNSLMNAVKDRKNGKRLQMKQRSQPFQVAYIRSDGTVQIFQETPEMYMSGVKAVMDYQTSHPEEGVFYDSPEEFFADEEREVSVVIDTSMYSSTQHKPPHVLHSRATISYDIDLHRGEVAFHFSHLIGNGVPVQKIMGRVPRMMMDKYGRGMLERDKVHFLNESHVEFITPKHEKKQIVGVHGLPDLNFKARKLAALWAIAQYPNSRSPEARKLTQKLGRASFTASSPVSTNYPLPRTGDKTKDYKATEQNAINIDTTTTAQHRDLLIVMDTIRTTLERAYGKNWSGILQNNPHIIQTLPPELIRQFEQYYAVSMKLMNESMEAARNNADVSTALVSTFYGKYMDPWVAEKAEASLNEKVQAQLHGDVLVTQIGEDLIVEPGDTIPYLNTVTPKGGKAVLATMKASPILARDKITKARGKKEWPEELNVEVQSHLLSWIAENPTVSRREIVEFSHYLSERWILMYHLNALFYKRNRV